MLNLDHLRQGIGLRQVGQRDPLNEYKAEAFALFSSMLDSYRFEVAHALLGQTINTADELKQLHDMAMQREQQQMTESRQDPSGGGYNPGDSNVVGFEAGRQASLQTIIRQKLDVNDPATWAMTPRNAPCPCGSGKKYKHCHGAVNGMAAKG